MKNKKSAPNNVQCAMCNVQIFSSLRVLIFICTLYTVHCTLEAQVVPTPPTRPTPGQRPTPARPAPVRPPLPGGGRLPGAGAAVVETPKNDGSAGEEILRKGLNYVDASSDMILLSYADLSGKTLIFHPQVPKATITLRSNPTQTLTLNDYLYAIRQALNQNGIDIRPFGDGSLFLNVVPLNLPTGVTPDMPEPLVYSNGVITTTITEPLDGRTRSIVYQLLNITTEEGRKIIEPYKRPEGQIIAIERNNSLQIIDTYENIVVMVKLLETVDKAIPVTEDVYARKILYAKAADIKRKLEEFVNKEQAQGAAASRISQSGSPTMVNEPPRPRPPTPGIIRPMPPGLQTPDAPANNPSISTAVSDADRGMIRGKVQIIDDERTNMLIIITNPPNMEFFDKIIAVFDVETAPDVMVDVIRMEHAAASDVASLLNDLLGATKAAETPAAAAARAQGGGRRGTTLAEAAAANTETPAAPAATSSSSVVSDATQSRIGELNKDNIKILHDERSNAVVIMATRSDLATLRDIIKSIDIQLSQVLIEVVVLNVDLGSNFQFGMDWVNRKFSSQAGTFRGQGAWGGGGFASPPYIGKAPEELSGILRGSTDSPGFAGLAAIFTTDKLNIDAVIRATTGDTNARVLDSPVLCTMDNKEAVIEATSLRYLFNGYRYTYSNNNEYPQEDIQQRNIGLVLKVTPRINQKGMVVLTIDGTFESVVEEGQIVNNRAWPTVNTRKINADIAVENHETVVLGGLTRTEKSISKTGVPYLRNIPLLGWFFRSTKEIENRSELLIFMTPYVLDNASQRAFEAERLKRAIGSNADIWTSVNSGSRLATPDPAEELRILRQQHAGEESIRKAEADLQRYRLEYELEQQRRLQLRGAMPAPVQPEIEEYEEVELPEPPREEVATLRSHFQKNREAGGELLIGDASAPLRVSTRSNSPDVLVLDRSAVAGILNTMPYGE